MRNSVAELNCGNGTELHITERVLFCIKWYFCKKLLIHVRNDIEKLTTHIQNKNS